MDKEIKIYLGVDWGEKRIGLSLSDSETKIATPFKVVDSIEQVLDIIKKENINIAVIGKPISLKGQDNGFLKEYDMFIAKLKVSTDISVEFIDERMTTKAADALPGDKKTKAPSDAIAAMIILQSYLDKIDI